jgi:hypothetical protein
VVGLDGSSKRAFHWYSRSALAGDAWGQNNLGACYEHGLGCVQSYPKAAKWYRRAETQGHGTATMNLGYCYLRGHGVPGDKLEASRLFRLAVQRGEDRAAKEVERLTGDRDIARSERDTQRSSDEDGRPRIRYVNGTEAGKHFGLVGVAGVAPPAAESRHASIDDVMPETAQKYAEHMDRVTKP